MTPSERVLATIDEHIARYEAMVAASDDESRGVWVAVVDALTQLRSELSEGG